MPVCVCVCMCVYVCVCVCICVRMCVSVSSHLAQGHYIMRSDISKGLSASSVKPFWGLRHYADLRKTVGWGGGRQITAAVISVALCVNRIGPNKLELFCSVYSIRCLQTAALPALVQSELCCQ